MKSIFSSLLLAFSQYSCFPKASIKVDRENSRYILIFIPIVGAIIGFCLYIWGEAWPYLCNYAILPAVIGAILPTIISGCSHMEGFIRTVDGISAHKSREKKLEILTTSQSGYFAILVCVIYFLLLSGLWSEIPVTGVSLLAFSFVLSRSLAGIAVLTLKHTDSSRCDMYVPENKSLRVFEILLLTVYACVCAYFMVRLNAQVGLACVLGALVSVVYFWITTYKHFGGITENCFNFFIQLSEMIIPLAALLAYKKWW